jgi:NDP-sugar pyrophosphorylase family protein
MRPLSDAVPKPALPLPDGPVIGWPLRLAVATGVRRVVVNTWHLAHRIDRALAAVNTPGIELVTSREEELMGTAGGLALARDRGLLDEEGPVLVLNGDCVPSLSLEPLFKHHAARDDQVTMALLPHPDTTLWSQVIVDGMGRVTRLLPRGPSDDDEVPLLYPGVMLVSRAALDALPSGAGGVAERLWEPARREGRLGGIVVGGHWREVGTPADYLAAVLGQLHGDRLVHPEARVDGSAVLGSVLIDEKCRIGADSILDRSVVAEGVVVGGGARVVDSVLLGRVEVPDGQEVVDEFRAVSSEARDS